jgi:hypothetical protein
MTRDHYLPLLVFHWSFARTIDQQRPITLFETPQAGHALRVCSGADRCLLSVGLTFVSIITLFFLKEIPLKGGRRKPVSTVEAVEESLAEESGLAVAD